ncbi:MAG: nucleotidyltransferase domain-containing protein [Candidatus Bathyarchaeota archaeon]
MQRFREGDFIESIEGLIFDVKGLVHPPDRVIAFVRYFPSPEGNRERNGIRYRKVYDLDERFDLLKKHFPKYLVYDPVLGEKMVEVPTERVARHYQPICKLVQLQSSSNVNSLENKTLNFVNFITDTANISRGKIGVSGSILVGLASSSSDLDLIIYGERNALKVDIALKKHLEEGKRLKKFNPEMLKKKHEDRCMKNGISLENYVFHELRKSFQGSFDGTEFFIRYVKDWDELEEAYGENLYASMGRVKARGTVVDDSDSLLTPCFYKLDAVEVVEGTAADPISGISSFRGRYCEQACVGESILACGKLERVIGRGGTSYRLLLGNHPEDFMVVIR